MFGNEYFTKFLHPACIHAFIAFFSLTWSSDCEKWCITRKSPLAILTYWILNMLRGLEVHKAKKGPEITSSTWQVRRPQEWKELESGQQEMQEKISRVKKMVINLTKGKGITDDPDLQRKPTSWEGCTNPSIELNSDDPCEQVRLRKDPFERSKHVDMQQRCSLMDKKLKKIEGVNNLGSVDPRELCLVPDVVIPPKFKMPKFEKYDRNKCPENHLTTYCNKTAGHAHNEDLLIHVLYDSLTGAAAQWY